MTCQCGHHYEDHHPLPFHPDGALECYGSDDCECGVYRPAGPILFDEIQGEWEVFPSW